MSPPEESTTAAEDDDATAGAAAAAAGSSFAAASPPPKLGSANSHPFDDARRHAAKASVQLPSRVSAAWRSTTNWRLGAL